MEKIRGFNAFSSIVRFLNRRRKGVLQFVQESVDSTLELPGGGQARMFRHMICELQRFASPSALVHVWFELDGTSFETLRRTSRIAIPLIGGSPGFRGKCWCVENESAIFHGFYSWQTHDHATTYKNSIAMRMLRMRAKKGSVRFEVMHLTGNPFNLYPHKRHPFKSVSDDS